MKNAFLGLGLSLLFGCSAAPAQQTPTNPDLALGKKYSSSDENITGWALGLTDGSWLPGKGTTFATGTKAPFPKNVTVDLESATPVGYVAIGVPPFGSTKTVSVELSVDGQAFNEVARTTFKTGEDQKHLLTFAPTSARYVRLNYLEQYPYEDHYQKAYAFTTEMAVYAPGVAPVLPSSPTLPEPADVAAPKLDADGKVNANFSKLHQSFLARGKEGPIGVLFLGDSITDHWRRENAKDVWARFEHYQPANFGIGGDKTENVLWRLENGELDGIKPKVVVLLIGTNNLLLFPDANVIAADTKIVAEIHRRLPDSKVLLLGIFSRGPKAKDPVRARIKGINAQLAKLDDGNKTRFLDFGDKFLEADGTIAKYMMADGLHPEPQGYTIWADSMMPLLDEMMK